MTTESHDPRTEHERILSRHCHALLVETATKLVNESALPPGAVATAFLSTGIGASLQTYGPAQTVEWLRDISDAIEREHFETRKH